MLGSRYDKILQRSDSLAKKYRINERDIYKTIDYSKLEGLLVEIQKMLTVLIRNLEPKT